MSHMYRCGTFSLHVETFLDHHFGQIDFEESLYRIPRLAPTTRSLASDTALESTYYVQATSLICKTAVERSRCSPFLILSRIF